MMKHFTSIWCAFILLGYTINGYSQDQFYKTNSPRPSANNNAIVVPSPAVQGASHTVAETPALFIQELPYCSEAVKKRAALNKQAGKSLADGIYKRYVIRIEPNKEGVTSKKVMVSLKHLEGFVSTIIMNNSEVELVVVPGVRSESVKMVTEIYKGNVSFISEQYFVK